jgi:hypothetical protein
MSIGKKVTAFRKGFEGKRPDFCDDEHLEYLDALRESGVTNMFGAGPYLEDEFCMEPEAARAILAYWMRTFTERHKDQQAKP